MRTLGLALLTLAYPVLVYIGLGHHIEPRWLALLLVAMALMRAAFGREVDVDLAGDTGEIGRGTSNEESGGGEGSEERTKHCGYRRATFVIDSPLGYELHLRRVIG